MKFDDLDKKMRVYEQSLDQVIVPGMFMAARIDGRSFTRLTKEVCKFEAPFDERFRDLMVDTVKALMDCGFRILYGYTESDEISLLFDPEENTFGRKVRKYNSILAGVASSAFSLELGQPAVFDCRVIPLPNTELVQDYFLWRQEDANRNALNSWCYWTLRKVGKSVAEATTAVSGKSVAYKNELLFERGINYDKLPSWQKRGTGVWWDTIEKTGYNPVKKREEKAVRRILRTEYELPYGKEYAELINSFLVE
ncbi:MAG: guanylyltransferase [Eubacterium sp.]|nr:guanylyltransferase [Eubacterium sp.]MBR3361181.1 guanylyltransferase [Lachnospiraceae bacterium]